ncbi:hypothetical protein COE45_28555 [Bacillus thuringiensis]|nr:hypothetical protein COE45_28555 [Bacillus thuringiensis]
MENLIKQQAIWRFELVITNSKNSEAEKLLESNYLRASFITVWSALETVVRSKLKNEKVKSRNSNVLQSIKNLYTFGLVSTEEYDFLQSQFKIRNLVVHGFKSPSIDSQNIISLITFIKNIQKYN